MKKIELNTIKELRSHLEARNISPEKFSKEVKLSHMTIRRWLRKPDVFKIPAKYQPIMQSYLDSLPSSPASVTAPLSATEALQELKLTELMESVEEAGRTFKDDGSFEEKLSDKLNEKRFDKLFVQYCKNLFQLAVSSETPMKTKAICIGALLYFINPIDMVPDHLPVVGFLDDFVVLSVAMNSVRAYLKEEKQSEVVS